MINPIWSINSSETRSFSFSTEEGPRIIPHAKVKSFLKDQVAENTFTLKDREIICNFFTPVSFSYTFFEKDEEVYHGMISIHIKDKELSFDAVDLIIRSPSPIVICKKILYFSDQHPLWSYIDEEGFIHLPHDLVEAIDDIPCHFEEGIDNREEPTPQVHLTHPTGLFARLEKGSEKDFLETAYQKRGENEYYCPSHLVKEALTFLLELGWDVYDDQKRKVHLISGANLSMDMDREKIHIQGSLSYGDVDKPISEVLPSIQKPFVSLTSDSVGLLPPKGEYKAIDLLDESFEITSSGVGCAKTEIATLPDIIPEINYSKQIQNFLKGMKNTSSIPEATLSKAFKGELRPYQQQGLNWLTFLYEGGFSALLADDMGLGKTVQVLSFLSQINSDKPHLIVVPTSLLFHWEREWKQFIGEGLFLYYGPTRDLSSFHNPKGILTTYALLRQDSEILQNEAFEVIVIDEGQHIKNDKSLTAKSLKSLKSQFRISLTGTPIENHLGELYSQFHFLLPSLLKDEVDVKKKIAPYILRREKTEVAKDLPPMQDQTILIEMEERQEDLYNQWITKAKQGLLRKIQEDGLTSHRMEVFELLLRLRQIACHPLLVQEEDIPSAKMSLALDDLEEMFHAKKRALVFSQFTSYLALIKRELNKKHLPHLYLDGNTKDREKIVDQFQNGDDLLFLISLKAGGTGLHLTEADTVIILDPWWNEAVEAQGIGRAYRIGRDKPLLVKRYITKNTIEEKMVTLKEKKQQLAEELLSPSSLNLEDLQEILKHNI